MRLPVDDEQAEQITGTDVVFNQRLEGAQFLQHLYGISLSRNTWLTVIEVGRQDGRPNVCGDWFLVTAERASFLTNFTEDQGRIDPTKTECIRNNMMHVFRACSITHEVEISGLFHRIVDVETGWQDLIA